MPAQKYSAITIADQILRIAKARGKRLTPLQLMKLTYIAHGWSFPIRGGDLFPDRIEAWKYGPVIPDLYQATKHFGRNEIPHDCIGDAAESVVDAETKHFLENVFDQYGGMSGIALSSLTHKSGTPWYQVFKPNVFGIEIPDDLIRDHYHRLRDERKPSSAA